MSTGVWVALVVASLGTYLERFAFLGLAHRATAVPDGVREALRMVPPAALAALVAPAVLRGGSTGGDVALADPRVVAAAVALVVMHRTRNVLLTIVVGMAVLLGLTAM